MTTSEYRREVERLLGEISDGSDRLLRLDLAGVRGGALFDEEQALERTRHRLAEVISRGAAAS